MPTYLGLYPSFLRFYTPSPKPLTNRKATTIRRCQFFNALSQDGGLKSLRLISKDCGIGETTGHNWKKQCKSMGSLTKRKTRKRSTKLSRPLKRKLKEHTKRGRRDDHIYNPLFSYFNYIIYTDEAYINPTLDRLKNIKERPLLKGVRYYITSWINHIKRPLIPPKPRRRPKTETEEEEYYYIAKWEAIKPYAHKVKDGDPSYSMRKAGLIREYKDTYNSPNLNPIKGIWAIIKQRLRQRIFNLEEEIKEAL
ncbi:hypothetical protein V2W45_1467453 [Cenococcum geophilum]